MEAHLIDLCDGWALWRDVAVRSAGFPVSGLDAFGPGDEAGRLRAVAADPRFREAVTWQNRAALHNAVDKVASGSPASGSKQRQREETVASYWQRYCSKNDTIGFFGPLAWGTIQAGGPALTVRPTDRAERSVHFESWCFEVLAAALDLPVQVPLAPWPERDVRTQLERLPDGDTRSRGLAALDRLEDCRSAVATAAPDKLDAALDSLDHEFLALTSASASRRPGEMYAARTLVYLDCMRGIELDIGPALRDELALTLPALLAGSRWFCGRIYEVLSQVAARVAERVGDGPAGPALGAAVGAIMAVPREVLEVNAELQGRWAELLADPDVTTLARRAEAAFAGYGPSWGFSVYHGPDVQVAARSAAAVDTGDFLCVVGDFHPGTNAMAQGVFANRHPDRERFLAAWASDVGRSPLAIPPRNAGRMGPRVMPAVTRPDDVHVALTPDSCMPDGYRVVRVADLVIAGGQVTSRDGSFSCPLVQLLELPMFVAGVRTYNPFPVEEHAPRITLSRTVLRRETWQLPAAAAPAQPAIAKEWAEAGGLPRRVFMLSPLEDKPVYVDFESPVLTGIACRLIRRAAAERPDGVIRFTEMIPRPEDCWLEDEEGRRYTSELRLAAVDLARRDRAGATQ